MCRAGAGQACEAPSSPGIQCLLRQCSALEHGPQPHETARPRARQGTGVRASACSRAGAVCEPLHVRGGLRGQGPSHMCRSLSPRSCAEPGWAGQGGRSGEATGSGSAATWWVRTRSGRVCCGGSSWSDSRVGGLEAPEGQRRAGLVDEITAVLRLLLTQLPAWRAPVGGGWAPGQRRPCLLSALVPEKVGSASCLCQVRCPQCHVPLPPPQLCDSGEGPSLALAFPSGKWA